MTAYKTWAQTLWKRKAYWLTAAVCMLAFCCNVACSWLASDDSGEMGNIVWTGGLVLRLLLGGAVFGLLGGAVCCFVFEWLVRRGATKALYMEPNETGVKTHTVRFFLCSVLLIFLSWLPCYLAYYPGICAYDTIVQVGQIAESAYGDNHPILHTLLIAGAMQLGETVFGDTNTGIGIMIFLQMTALAAAYAGGITYLRRRGVHRGFLIALQLLSMLYPFNGYLAVSMSKDILFTVFFCK